MLTHNLFQNEGLNVGMAGNIGDSFAQMVAQEDKEYYVLEISSFQLDGNSFICTTYCCDYQYYNQII